MIRLLYCHGQKHSDEPPENFFLITRIQGDERAKHRELTPEDIRDYTRTRYPALCIKHFQEDPALSMLAQKMYALLLGHQDDTAAMELIERLLTGGAQIALGITEIHPLTAVEA